MPLYDYQCLECEAIFEELVRTPRDEKKVRCEECGSPKVEKQVSAFCACTGRGRESSSSSKCSGGNCGSCRSSCCR